MAWWDTSGVTEQIAIRLDDGLAENARAAAAAAGTTLSDWVRSAIRQQVALATALRARAEEDVRIQLYTDAEEDALMDARQRRALAAFDHPDPDAAVRR
jgi:antitoxin component of RelBE/YafQ-DinJ toxin-antitoxin module